MGRSVSRWEGRFFLVWFVALMIQAGPVLAQQPVIKQSRGQTARTVVPMVSQTWDSTLSVRRATPTRRQARFIGHFPGFLAAKRKANRALKKQLSSLSQTAAPSTSTTSTLAPQAPASGFTAFDGPSESDTSFIPPDSQVAAGPNYVVVVINSLIAIYDKTGVLQGNFQQLDSFFSSLGVTGGIYDPRIIYDQTDGRFILTVADVDQTGFTQGHVLLAVSQTSDPTGVWNKYALNFMGRNPSNTANTFPDFPTLGLSSSAVYISTGQFMLDSACMANDTCSFSDTWIKVVGLPALLAGSSTLSVTTFENVTTASGYPAFTIEPAVTYGTAPGEFLVAASFNANPGTVFNVFEINTSGTPVLSTADLTVPNFSMPPDAIQPGSGYPIATNDFRLLNAVWSNGSLWCGQNVLQSKGPGVDARWYQIAAPSLGTLSVTQTGDVTGSGDAYYPALGIKPNGDVGMVFTTSSSTQYASAAFTGRAASDPPDTMRTVSIYQAGSDDYVDFDTRWGDYSGISPDPDGGSLWTIAEYAGSPDPHFGTAIAQAGSAPALGLSSTEIDFGSETVNVTSAPQTVTVTNSSSASLTLGTATLSGSDPSDFAISSDGCSNVTLAAGQTCTLSLTFTPAAIETESAVLLINTNPAGLPEQVYLTGQGAAPTAGLNISPTSITFPDTPAHTESAPQVIQVTNTSTSAEALEIRIASTEYPFTQSNNCGASLPAGQTCQISVVFRPSTVSTFYGTYPADLSISYQGFPSSLAPLTVDLYGTSVAAPLTTLCPTAINFGNQTVGTTSAPQSVTISNSGTSNMTVSTIQISGTFSETNTCGTLPATVAPYSSCSVSVVFAPKAAGTQTGTLTISDNAGGNSQTVQLTGTGVTSTAQLLLPFQELQNQGYKGLLSRPRAAAVQHAALRVRRATQLATARYGKLPLSFEANEGQTSPRVKYLSRGAGYTMFLTDEGAVLELRGGVLRKKYRKTTGSQKKAAQPAPLRTDVVRMTLVGANNRARVSGLDELPGKANYLIGNDPSKWKTNVPLYTKVKYRNVYPGTDLVYYGNPQRLEYDFVLRPGANPNAIRFRIEASPAIPGRPRKAAPLRIAANGDLVIQTTTGEVRFRKPVVYQPSTGSRRLASVKRRYLNGRFLLRKARHNGYQVAFRLASYNRSKPLVIDPVLSYSTYIGGSGADSANAIAVDSSGSAYVAGTTASANFPLANPLQSKINRTLPNETDAFITKLSPDGASLVYSTFLGGSNNERARAIAVDSQGNVYVGGETKSSDFPVTKGAFQTVYKGGLDDGDGFLAKINATGSALVYSSYFGGSGDDLVTALALDSAEDAYIAGVSNSPDLPTTSGAPQTAYGGATTADCTQNLGPPDSCGDAFVAEMNPQGTGLVYSTYLGGSGDDYASGLAVDSTGAAYVTGTTDSIDFPTTPGAFQTWLSPSSTNAFITKVEPQGTGLAYSTYLGPTSGNAEFGVQSNGIAIDAQGDVYVTGETDSANFPTVNPIQTGRPVSPLATQAFVSKLQPAGCGLIYSTRLGGFRYTQGLGIAADSGGDAYVTGWTQDADFPTLNPFQASNRQTGTSSGSLTAFVTELALSGSKLIYSSYLGGSQTDLPNHNGGDVGNAITVDSAGNAYVAGKTSADDFPIVSAAQSQYAGQYDAFVTKVNPTVVPSITLSPASLTFPDTAIGTTSAPLSVTVTNTTSNPVTISSVTTPSGNTWFGVANNSCDTTLQPNASCTFGVTFTPTNNGIHWGVVNVNDNAFAGPHSVPTYGTGYTPAAINISGNNSNSEFLSTPVGSKITGFAQVENPGTQSLTVSGVSVSGTGFSQTNNCTSPLSFQQQCTVNLTFAPTAAGTVNGTLTVTGDASDSPQTLPLTGVGQDFSVSATPGTSSSATITAGQTATFSVDVGSSTGFDQPISLACSGAPAYATCLINPTSTVIYGTTPATTTVTIRTLARAAGSVYRFDGPSTFGPNGRELPYVLLGLLMAGLLALIFSRRFMPALARRRAWIGLSAVVLLVVLWVSCGGGGGGGSASYQASGTPAGTYTITITGTSGNLNHSATFKLTVH